MALVTGVFNTSFNPAELNTRSFNAAILRLFPNGSAPLFGLTAQTKKRRAKASTHGYFTKTFTFPTLTMTAAAIAGDTTLTVASTTGVVPGMVYQVPVTRELVVIVTVPNATSVTVTRAYGRIAAGAIGAADVLGGVGNSHAEGSLRPTARAITTVYIPNYTEIFRNAWAVTDTARASLTEAGFGNVTESRKDAMLFHATDIEMAAFFGQPQAPAIPAGGTQPVHATQGIIDAVYQYAAGNIQVAGATTTYAQLVALLEPMFAFASNMGNAKERVGFVDAQALRVLNDIGRLSGQVEITLGETTFGLAFTSFRFYKGTIRLIEHPMFNGLPSMTGTMVVVDLPAIGLAYMEGRDAKVEEYGLGGKPVTDGADSVGGSLTSELAVETINPLACGVISNLTAGA